MKRITLLKLLFILSPILFSCSKDDDVDPGFTVNYKNQVLQGKINGEEWIFEDGFVLTAPTGNEFFHSFTMLDTMIDTVNCVVLSDSTAKILFSKTDTSAILRPGVTKLFHDPLEPTLTVTIRFSYYDADTIKQFVTLSQGSYEILTVDTSANFIEGRMHVRANSNNTVNGNFRLRYCAY